MQFTNYEKPHWLEKVLRYALPIGAGLLGFMFFNSIASTLIAGFDNLTSLMESIVGAAAATVTAAIVCIPIIFMVMYVISNPQLISMTYKNLCRKLTGFFIKLDFLSYMDSYVEILKEKRKNLQTTKRDLLGKKIELERQINDIVDSFQTNMKKAQAAKQLGNDSMASHHASLGSSDKESINQFKPILDRMEKNLKFLDKLDENWGLSIEKIEHTVKRKRVEYETTKKMAKAIGQAEEFARGDGELARNYQLSLKALEENLSQKIAAIEEFEKNSKSIMAGIDLEKQMNQNEGLKLLEQFEASGNSILFPENEDYTEVKIISSTTNPSPTSAFSHLLKK